MDYIKRNIREKYLKKPLIFSVPGSKVYISSYYRNRSKSFLNISVTGDCCSLLCKHCRGLLLKSMHAAQTSEKLVRLVDRSSKKGLEGILISGGFDKEGRLCLDDVMPGIKKIKAEHPGIKVMVHTGFVDDDAALGLKEASVDGVLTNLIGSSQAISNIYNLENIGPSHFYRSIETLKKHGLKVSPHIIMGIDEGSLDHEFAAVEKAISLGADSLVFVVIKRVSKKLAFLPAPVGQQEIIELIGYAKKLSPGLPISLGCAKPAGQKTASLEKSLIGMGIDSIAFPSEKAIGYAEDNSLAYEFVEKCCAVL